MNYLKTAICVIGFLLCFNCMSVTGQATQKKEYAKNSGGEKLEITGAIPGLNENESVFLNIWDAKKSMDVTVDSSTVKNGKFYFNYFIEDGPRLFWIKFSKHNHIIAVPFDNEKVTITSDVNINDIKAQSAFQYLRVEGSESAKQHLYLNYALYNSWYYSRAAIDVQIRRYKDSTLNHERLTFLSGMLSARKLMDKTIGEILLTQPVKEVIPEFFANLPVQFQRDSFFVTVFNRLDDRIKKSYYGTIMKDQVRLCVGQSAPDFTFAALDGKTYNFSKIAKGSKVTILSFWSNKSVDRQRINGELSKVYKKYHDKGLEVVSVSLDANPDKWKRVVEEDRIPGYQTCDFKEEESAVAKLYKADPRDTVNVLIDQNGNIVGWDVDGVLLQTYLFRIFGE